LATNLQRDLTGLSRITYGNGIEGQWQRSAEGVLARVVYRRTGTPQAASGLRAWIEQAIPSARAQAAAPAASAAASAPVAPAAPGAIAEPEDPSALWDSRLLYDSAGNLIVVRDSGVLVNSQARWNHYSYDRLNQLVQAWQTMKPANVTLAQSVNDPDANIAKVWRYHHDSLGNRLLMQQPGNGADTPLRKVSHTDPVTTLPAAAPGTGLPGEDPLRPHRQWQWNPDGTLRAVLQDGKELARYAYNHEGLRVMKQSAQQAAEYTLYDEQRHRIADLDAQGRITRQYVWMGDQLLAMLDPQKPRAPQSDQASDIFATIAAAWQHLTGEDLQMSYVHNNHLGAPIAISDRNANTVWQAQYAPYGQRIEDQSGQPDKARPMKLDLRLPGQWADAETGLHYNDQRYYDPKVGRYISADPLGLQGGLNRYAYVGNNPLGFTDPLGLVLFAFDGTDNSNDPRELARLGGSLTNVALFMNAYGGSDARVRYVSGVGTHHYETNVDRYGNKYLDIIPTGVGPVPDRGGNWTGRTRIQRMADYMDDEAEALKDDTEVMNIDIVGFSRGAAQARDFANRIARQTRNGVYHYQFQIGVDPNTLLPKYEPRCQSVNLRFMGLFDTVLGADVGLGDAYRMGIPTAFSYVAQAVALNEYRSQPYPGSRNILANGIFWSATRFRLPEDLHYGGFALDSIGASSTTPGRVRIERGFVGAHADIGGGYRAGTNQLSYVALNWMVAQAKIAGMQVNDVIDIDMNNPVVHDQSNAIRVGNPTKTPQFTVGQGPAAKTYAVEDREVYSAVSGNTQRTQGFNNSSLTNAGTHGFISYAERDPGYTGFLIDEPGNPGRQLRNDTGRVNMPLYVDWLRKNGYCFARDACAKP
jgi:RHS repeat-associated protein